MKKIGPTPENIAIAAEQIRSGGVVAFPTETVYGLGASAFDDSAIQQVFGLKGRPADNPLIVHIASMDDLDLVTTSVPDWTRTLMKKFWPGPISFVLPVSEQVSQKATAGLSTVAVRMPDHKTAHALIRQAGVPLVAPSANISGRPSPTTADDVVEDFADTDLLVIDGGPCQVGIESTVVLCLPEKGIILRPGVITKEEMASSVDVPIELDQRSSKDTPQSPGMKYRHYAPQARVVLVDEVPAELRNAWLCVYGEEGDGKHISEQNLYRTFRDADKEGIETIYILDTQKLRENTGLYNRIQKAAE